MNPEAMCHDKMKSRNQDIAFSWDRTKWTGDQETKKELQPAGRVGILKEQKRNFCITSDFSWLQEGSSDLSSDLPLLDGSSSSLHMAWSVSVVHLRRYVDRSLIRVPNVQRWPRCWVPFFYFKKKLFLHFFWCPACVPANGTLLLLLLNHPIGK